MKIRFRTKANDAIITLYNIPFDTKQFEKVATALKSLGPNVDKMVTLKSRDSEVMKFDFKGEEAVLKPFFEKYYSSISWSELQKKFETESSADNKTPKTGLVADFQAFLFHNKFENAKLELKGNELIFKETANDKLSRFLREQLSNPNSDFNRFFKQRKLKIKQLIVDQEDKRSLKNKGIEKILLEKL